MRCFDEKEEEKNWMYNTKVKNYWSIAGGDVRGGAGNGALRESLLDLQQRQCYRDGPFDQGRGTHRSQCPLP